MAAERTSLRRTSSWRCVKELEKDQLTEKDELEKDELEKVELENNEMAKGELEKDVDLERYELGMSKG